MTPRRPRWKLRRLERKPPNPGRKPPRQRRARRRRNRTSSYSLSGFSHYKRKVHRFSHCKKRYTDVKTLAMEYAAMKGVAQEEEKKAKEELKKERRHSRALASDVDQL